MSPEPILPSVKSYPKSTDTKWARMGYWLLSLLIFNLSFLISACGLDIEDPTPPSPPVWVQKSLPEEWPERGIDAHETGGIFLEWHESLEENIFVYHLYRAARNDVANSISEYQEIAIIEKYNSPGIEYIDQDIHTNTRYFYKLQAEDESGNFSDSSATISYMVFSSAGFFRMEPNGLTDGFIENRTLKWWSSYTLGIEDYILTVLTTHNEILIRVRIQPTNYVSESEEWQIPYEVDLVFGEQYLWRIDMGARYENGVETAGSESPWASFLVGL